MKPFAEWTYQDAVEEIAARKEARVGETDPAFGNRGARYLIGLEANGFHTNGYSLVRRVVFDRLGLDVADRYPGMDESVADVDLFALGCKLRLDGDNPALVDADVQ